MSTIPKPEFLHYVGSLNEIIRSKEDSALRNMSELGLFLYLLEHLNPDRLQEILCEFPDNESDEDYGGRFDASIDALAEQAGPYLSFELDEQLDEWGFFPDFEAIFQDMNKGLIEVDCEKIAGASGTPIYTFRWIAEGRYALCEVDDQKRPLWAWSFVESPAELHRKTYGSGPDARRQVIWLARHHDGLIHRGHATYVAETGFVELQGIERYPEYEQFQILLLSSGEAPERLLVCSDCYCWTLQRGIHPLTDEECLLCPNPNGCDFNA